MPNLLFCLFYPNLLILYLLGEVKTLCACFPPCQQRICKFHNLSKFLFFKISPMGGHPTGGLFGQAQLIQDTP
jgi:hypothetical protein